MAFLIGGANSAADTGYDIENSLRIKHSDEGYLGIDYSASASDRKKFTASFWVKRGLIGSHHQYIFGFDGSGNIEEYFVFESSTGYLQFDSRDASGGSSDVYIRTDMNFRDPSAWYHIVIAADSTDGTAGNRFKVYVNGVQQDLTTSTAVPEDYEFFFNETTGTKKIGVAFTSNFYDGYLSEFYFIDGTVYDADDFGETDSSGIWKPKEAKDDLTFGNNGFFLEFKETGTSQNSSGIGADTSGNDNHWAVVSDLNSRDIQTDTPTNNFATLNPLDVRQGGTFVDGNCQVTTDSSNRNYVISTIGASNGKWYCEATVADGAANAWLGVADFDDLLVSSSSTLGDNSNEIGLGYEGTYQKNNSYGVGWSGSYADADIIGVLLDLDNNRITYHKNGSYSDGSGNFDESSPTAYISFTNSTMGFAFGDGAGAATSTYKVNFGNPITTISSGNADANGYGNFEYAVPSGYYALCTKNLAEYG